TRCAAARPPPTRAGSPPPDPAPRTRRRTSAAARARTGPPPAPPRGSSSGPPRPPRSRPRLGRLAAIDLVEESLGRGDVGPPAEGVGDELRGLRRAMAELLDQDLPHHLAQPLGVGGRGRAGHGLRHRALDG